MKLDLCVYMYYQNQASRQDNTFVHDFLSTWLVGKRIFAHVVLYEAFTGPDVNKCLEVIVLPLSLPAHK